MLSKKIWENLVFLQKHSLGKTDNNKINLCKKLIESTLKESLKERASTLLAIKL